MGGSFSIRFPSARAKTGGWQTCPCSRRSGLMGSKQTDRVLETRQVCWRRMKKLIALEPGRYYHVYNRGNNRENIFLEERNYHYFLGLYLKYIEPVADTFAYCLLRNHFHLLIRAKTHRQNENHQTIELTPREIQQQFSNLFNSYAKAINKAYNRSGSLFQKRFGRIEVTSNRYFLALISYIHFNPQKHRFAEDFRDYPYSSYRTLLSTQPTRVKPIRFG
jgi:REP element-mobilizing transposase RayT